MSSAPLSTEDAVARNQAAGRLRALRQENYRATRWQAIDAARKLNMTWEQIGEALGVMAPSANRMYAADAPKSDD